MGINLETIQASRCAEAKDAELQREVEVKRAEMELERMRAYVCSQVIVPYLILKLGHENMFNEREAQYYAGIILYPEFLLRTYHADWALCIRTDVVQATIKRESAEQAAEAKLYSETKNANGLLYKEKQAAEGRLFMETKSAEGFLYKQRQDAEANCE